MSLRRTAFALALAATTSAALAQTQSFKHPQTGQECVSSAGAERRSTGHVYLHFKNICDRSFSVRVRPPGETDTRGTGIGRGTPSSPGTTYITCKAADRCEAGEWFYR